jgi:hypothetical protein
LAHELNQVDQAVEKKLVITKILTVLPVWQ